MKRFRDLTAEEAWFIQKEKINTALILDNAEIEPYIKVASLNSWSIELPLIGISSKAEIRALLAGVEANHMTGKLQWMHLHTYFNDGVPRFRKIDEDHCEMYLDFTLGNRQSLTFNPNQLTHEIDGYNGLRAVRLLQVFSTIQPLTLIPSVSIKVDKDGEIYGPQSLADLVSIMQPNAHVGVINRFFSGFNKLTIEVIYNNIEIDEEINLSYI